MATNAVQLGNTIQVTKASVNPGDPVVVGVITGVSEDGTYTDANGVVNQCQVDTTGRVWNLAVKGVTNSATNIAVAIGDQLYISDGHTPKIDKDTTGVLFGVALAAVGSGATATIAVKHNTL